MLSLLTFFGTLWGRVALGAGIVASLVALRVYDTSKQRAIGAERAVAKIEKATDNATTKGKRAAERSRDGSVRGPVDPSTRHD